jgi:hypothetical protein
MSTDTIAGLAQSEALRFSGIPLNETRRASLCASRNSLSECICDALRQEGA